MENPQGFDPYEVLVSLVVPRPIAWVSTVSREGIPNLAPFSFYNAVCDEPPVVMFSISKREGGVKKDTARNILNMGEFVINFVSDNFLEKVKITAQDYPPWVDEFEKAGLQKARCYKVQVPRVAGTKAWLECKLLKHEELFEYDLIFGRVLFAGAESLDVDKLKPIGRFAGKFCKIIEINQDSKGA
ncbi:MAG: flavin reductase family protein [Candidatus Kryptonium sp.]